MESVDKEQKASNTSKVTDNVNTNYGQNRFTNLFDIIDSKMKEDVFNSLSEDEKNRYHYMRKSTLAYWNITSYLLFYIIAYPTLFHKSKSSTIIRMGKCFVFSCVGSFATTKYFCMIFNKEYYRDYKLFCLKRNIKDYLLLGL